MGKGKTYWLMSRFWQNIKRAYGLIPFYFRRKVRWCLAFTFLNGLLDIISLAAIIPVILIFLNPNQINENALISELYNLLEFGSDRTFKVFVLAGVVILFIVKNAISTLINHYQNRTMFDLATDLSRKTFKSFFSQPYLEFTKSNSALISRKINTIPHDYVAYILASYLNLITEVVIGGFILMAIGIFSPIICLLLIAAIIPLITLWKWFKKQHIERIENEFRNYVSISLKSMMKGVDGYIDVKLYGKESYFIKNFVRLKNTVNRNYAFIKTTQFLPSKILEVVLIICITVIFAYTSLAQITHTLIPMLSLFIAGFYRLYPSITKILSAKTSIGAYNYVLDELDSFQYENVSTESETAFTEQITFDKISFEYPGKRQLFKDLNLQIKKGDCLGIMGDSGAGKTTLIKILIGLIPPDQGKILIDDTQLSENHISSWLSKIGYLQQSPVIIDGTIEENIAFGEQIIDQEKLTRAIDSANLSAFIKALPHKLNTIVGENGHQISGGQVQRIALARALYHDSDILIFDEISNNLDDYNLSKIKETIKMLNDSGKTILLIDHNDSLMELTNKIWHVRAGTVERLNYSLTT